MSQAVQARGGPLSDLFLSVRHPSGVSKTLAGGKNAALSLQWVAPTTAAADKCVCTCVKEREREREEKKWGRCEREEESTNMRQGALPWHSAGKESARSAGDLGSASVLGGSPGGGKWQPTPVLLPGESHGQRSLVGYSPWGHRVRRD